MHPSNAEKLNQCNGWFKDETPASNLDIDTLLHTRGEQYGRFSTGASIMRQLKKTLHDSAGWGNLTPSQQEALEMIMHKIGRILNGKPDYTDSWQDIAGYALLIVKQLDGENP